MHRWEDSHWHFSKFRYYDVESAIQAAAQDCGTLRLLSEACNSVPIKASDGFSRLDIGEAVSVNGQFFGPKGCRHVIFTVGPRHGHRNWQMLLREAFIQSFSQASRCSARSIALPAISTGVFQIPHERVSEIALDSVAHLFAKDISSTSTLNDIYFVLKSEKPYDIWCKMADDMFA